MGYYVRILSTSATYVPLSVLRKALEDENHKATIFEEGNNSGEWTQIMLKHEDGTAIAAIERNPVESDSLGAAELEEFAEEIVDCKPTSAVRWLLDFFPRVRCIYVHQVLWGTDHKNGWDIFGTIKNSIWAHAPSIFQADAEGNRGQPANLDRTVEF